LRLKYLCIQCSSSLLIAWGLWAIVRGLDRRNARIAAAPLPIKLVNVWDRVWIRGEIVIAGLCGFRAMPLFAAELEEKVVPRAG